MCFVTPLHAARRTREQTLMWSATALLPPITIKSPSVADPPMALWAQIRQLPPIHTCGHADAAWAPKDVLWHAVGYAWSWDQAYVVTDLDEVVHLCVVACSKSRKCSECSYACMAAMPWHAAGMWVIGVLPGTTCRWSCLSSCLCRRMCQRLSQRRHR